MPTGWTATVQSPASDRTATGFILTPSVDRMPTWGWLMTGAGDHGAVAPDVGDREGAAGEVVGGEALGAGPLGQVGDLVGEGPQALATGVLHHRDHEGLEVDVDGHAEVDAAVHDQHVVADRGVHVRELAEGVDDRPGDEGRKDRPAARRTASTAW